MKKILRLVMLFVLFVCLFGCSLGGDKLSDNKQEENTNDENRENNENNQNENNNENQNNNESSLVKVEIPDIEDAIISDAFKSFDLSYDISQIETKKNELIAVIKNAKSVDEINTAYDAFSSYNEEIYDKYVLAETLYNADMSNETFESASYDLYEMTLNLQTAFDEVDVEIAKSDFASAFFSGYTAEEIEALANSDIDNDELNTILMHQKELQDKFYSARSDKEKDTILKTFVNNNKRIAELNGYNNNEYIKYSDTNNYLRLYTSEEINNFESYVYENILDLSNELFYLGYKLTNKENQDKVKKLSSKSFMDNMDFITNYVDEIGGDFKETFNDLFDNGYYIISNNTNSYSAAYQDAGYNVRLLFFGCGYQDVSTFIHEFGHYYTSAKGTDNYSYDLCEVHSQGDEILLRLYFLENNPGDASKYYEYRFVSSLLDTVIDGVMIREFEEAIYKEDVQSLQETWNTINEKYDEFSGDDWYELFIDYDNYYISYATSAMGALVLYAYGKENGFEKAKEAYLKLCSYDGLGDIEEAFTYAGLPNPLAEDTIKDVVSVIKNEMENSWN